VSNSLHDHAAHAAAERPELAGSWGGPGRCHDCGGLTFDLALRLVGAARVELCSACRKGHAQ
jgi:hypothetical protein